MSGGIPNELTSEDYKHLRGQSEVYYVYGEKDEYINGEFLKLEKNKIKNIFKSVNSISFEGNHQVNVDIIESIIN